MLNTFFLAMKLLWREWRSGQWFIIFFALLLAITAMTGLSFYTDRLTRGLQQQSAKVLGGDLVISSPLPIPQTWMKKANTFSLHTAEVWIYPSMLNTKNKLQLINVQAVSTNYPLTSMTALHFPTETILVEPRLLPLLSLHLNDTVMIGAASLRIHAILPSDFDMMDTGWIIAPRILMHLEDVPATHTVLPGSRIDYRLLITGDAKSLFQFRKWLTPQLTSSQRLLDINTQHTFLYDMLQRAENYTQLVLLICLLMSGVAITLSSHQYIRQHYSSMALWRCLGAQSSQILWLIIWQLIILAFFAGVIGILLGYGLQEALGGLFKDFLHFPLPRPSFFPILLGFITSVLLLFCYSYPLISLLPQVSPLYIWRNEIAVNRKQQTIYFILSLSALLLYILWAMDFSLLTLFFMDAILLSIGFLYAFSIIMLRVAHHWLDKTEGIIRRGLSQLVQYPEAVSLQLTAFTLISLSLLVLISIRHNLISDWQQSLPEKTPNYFAFNLSATDVNKIKPIFLKQHITIENIYSMVRGRLIALNGHPILSVIPLSARTHNALHRELNLSATFNYPSDNKLIEGKAWTLADAGKMLVSVEKSLADDFRLKLGDTLTFQVGDQQISAVVSNIRSVNWQSFHPNFYVIFPPGALNAFPTTYITSFHLTSSQTLILNLLQQQFPNITIIDVADIILQIQNFIIKVTQALAYLFFIALGAAILIFITGILASLDERKQTYRLLRILGASKNYIYGSMGIEFMFFLLSLILFSSLLAKIISFLLMKTFF